MKKTIIVIITALMAFSVSLSAGPRKKAELKEVTFSVHLHCENCVNKVQENIVLPRKTLRMMQPPRHIRAMPP